MEQGRDQQVVWFPLLKAEHSLMGQRLWHFFMNSLLHLLPLLLRFLWPHFSFCVYELQFPYESCSIHSFRRFVSSISFLSSLIVSSRLALVVLHIFKSFLSLFSSFSSLLLLLSSFLPVFSPYLSWPYVNRNLPQPPPYTHLLLVYGTS